MTQQGATRCGLGRRLPAAASTARPCHAVHKSWGGGRPADLTSVTSRRPGRDGGRAAGRTRLAWGSARPPTSSR
jgi:hypothetical protein